MNALVAFARFAAKRDLRWFVFGAVAVNLHGFPRTTADVDITLDLGDLDVEKLVVGLRSGGFIPRFSDKQFIQDTRVLPVVHNSSKIPMDLVFAGPGLEQIFFEELVECMVAGIRIPVISPEHLIVTKILAARPRDLEDVRELLAMRAVDIRKIEELLAMLEEALSQSDLITTFRRLKL
ncbi:MAG: nucleotidyl transferase AbiEii/AbiGii toxin family protein [Kofleriaceae bacterium]